MLNIKGAPSAKGRLFSHLRGGDHFTCCIEKEERMLVLLICRIEKGGRLLVLLTCRIEKGERMLVLLTCCIEKGERLLSPFTCCIEKGERLLVRPPFSFSFSPPLPAGRQLLLVSIATNAWGRREATFCEGISEL